MFEVKNISKQYNGEYALNQVSLTINKGMNFIVGASGSGKTTLLNILSGIDQDFHGDVYYYRQRMKSLTANEKSYFYNNNFGFVWQDFHLLEDSSVLENVMLPQYLKDVQNKKVAEKILKDLKIFNLAAQKVKHLSGGQKQRVAIARELMKNPQVMITDEPTSALDKESAKSTMDILRTLSKNRVIIVVTHDTSLITDADHVYQLDKGQLIAAPAKISSQLTEVKKKRQHDLSLKNAFLLGKSTIKRKVSRFAVSSLSLVVASMLLLTTVSGAINNSGQKEFDQLMNTYGESLCDISIINSFTDAAGTDGGEQDKPKGDVAQNIKGLYDLYSNDDRVSFITYLQAFDQIKITVDGKSYSIPSSGSVPNMNKLIAGKMPMGKGKEVVVPESFAKSLGISPKNILGEKISFSGSIYNWSSGNPVSKSTNAKVTIVGVMDTTMKYEVEGKIEEYSIDDGFLFSKNALSSMTKQAGTDINKQNFLIRAKTPDAMIDIKTQLSKKGIVPLGRFELVEDMVRLNNQTSDQSGVSSIMIGVLSVVMVIAIFLITGFMRKKEIAIYKITGFTTGHLLKFLFGEITYIAFAATVFMIIGSPLLNLITTSLFGMNILNGKILFIGWLMTLSTAVIAYITTAMAFVKVKINKAFKAGDRS